MKRSESKIVVTKLMKELVIYNVERKREKNSRMMDVWINEWPKRRRFEPHSFVRSFFILRWPKTNRNMYWKDWSANGKGPHRPYFICFYTLIVAVEVIARSCINPSMHFVWSVRLKMMRRNEIMMTRESRRLLSIQWLRRVSSPIIPMGFVIWCQWLIWCATC